MKESAFHDAIMIKILFITAISIAKISIKYSAMYLYLWGFKNLSVFDNNRYILEKPMSQVRMKNLIIVRE